jgi:hypothetical protein
MTTARNAPGGAGTQTAGLAFGGKTTVNVAATEEYTAGGTPVTKSVTAT